jgi:hypothetical protein
MRSDRPTIPTAPRRSVSRVLLAAAGALSLAACVSANDDAGLLHVVTSAASYEAGDQIEPGTWTGMSRNGVCRYRIVRAEGSKIDEQELNPMRGVSSFDLRDGDALEITKSEYFPDAEFCSFWNDDESPASASSDVPWRDVEGTILPKDLTEWKKGQFEFLDDVQKRVDEISESQLSEMAIWICKVNAATGGNGLAKTKKATEKFAHLDDVEADYLNNTATKHLCP